MVKVGNTLLIIYHYIINIISLLCINGTSSYYRINMRRNSSKEENILPPLARSKTDFEEKLTSRSINASTHKFKILQTVVWTNGAKDLIRKDQVSELDRKLTTEMKADNNNSSNYLITLKRTHDEMAKRITRRQKETKRLREEIEGMKRQIDICQKESEYGKREIQGLEKNFNLMKNKQQTSALTEKTLEHILSRMKKDEITYQIKINFLQKRAKQLNAAMNQSEHKKYQLTEFEALSTIAAREVKESYFECSLRRKKDMQQYQGLIKKKKQSDYKEEQRRKVTDEIQAMAGSDLKDANLLKWKKLLMAHLVFKKILKSKINNIQAKYGYIKDAFHEISIKTTIDDPKILGTGYFKLQETYLNLVNDVKDLQKRQKQLQNQKQEHLKHLQALNNEFNTICNNEAQKSNKDNEMQFLRSTTETSQRNFQIKLIEQKMYSWLLQNIWKFDNIKARQLGFTEKKKFTQIRSKERMQQYMAQFCNKIMQLSAEMQKVTKDQPQAVFQQLKSLEIVDNRVATDANQEDEVETDELQKTRKKAFRP